MCGIAGVVRRGERTVAPMLLRRMAGAIRHRGPDGFGYYCSPRCGLAHVRLSIIDLPGGGQPLTNEDGRLLIVYNGEVFNYLELRRELEGFGHQFRTRSDTEVLVHGYEQWGESMLERLNGQFAFALYDRVEHSLFLARDRFGVRPLFVAEQQGDLYFASEAKALFATGEVTAAPDLQGIDEVFTLWASRAPRTVFRGVRLLEPGTCAIWRDGALRCGRYFRLRYQNAREEPSDAISNLDHLMRDSVRLRLRADVPVGGYLSGGVDSSITCALAAHGSPHRLRTFSVSFEDPAFDESVHQRLVAGEIRSQHHVQSIRGADVANVFPDVVWHAETPLLRTAPAPLFLLARLAREHAITVVLTGEGADEMFLGYDLFKETALRLFCLRQPTSVIRPRLFDRLYPYLGSAGRGGELWRNFFLNAGPTSDPLFSHLPRFRLAEWAKTFFAPEVRGELAGSDALQELRDSLPADFAAWTPLHRADYLEITTLMSSYLLSSQGDRMAMAHGVEGRFPFLDYRLFELAAALPERSKLRGLREKDILRRWAAGLLPPSVHNRPKQPYRAPDIPPFFAKGAPAYVDEMLDPVALRKTGLFDSARVTPLIGRCRKGLAVSARESQALVGILSTQLWYDRFFNNASLEPDMREPDVVLQETEGARDQDLMVVGEQ